MCFTCCVSLVSAVVQSQPFGNKHIGHEDTFISSGDLNTGPDYEKQANAPLSLAFTDRSHTFAHPNECA